MRSQEKTSEEASW